MCARVRKRILFAERALVLSKPLKQQQHKHKQFECCTLKEAHTVCVVSIHQTSGFSAFALAPTAHTQHTQRAGRFFALTLMPIIRFNLFAANVVFINFALSLRSFLKRLVRAQQEKKKKQSVCELLVDCARTEASAREERRRIKRPCFSSFLFL